MSSPIYVSRNLPISNVLDGVLLGSIGLPDLQRPFVWKNDKVRDLLDSMLRGYPIGYIMLWDSPNDLETKSQHIGTNEKAYAAPKSLVIDGQQRLTVLLASLYGVEVKDKNYNTRKIRIAYDPLTRVFKNADATTDRDSRFVSSVADVFSAKKENRLRSFRREFSSVLNESKEKKRRNSFN